MIPCASLHMDASAQVSIPVSTAETGSCSRSTNHIPTSSSQPQEQSKPYRVTDTTIKDIKDFHASQLFEYDYIVDGSMVSHLAQS